jgi:hypothetical protein
VVDTEAPSSISIFRVSTGYKTNETMVKNELSSSSRRLEALAANLV